MADIVDRATRSRMMSGIRGKNTKPEIIVRRFLHSRGLRFKLHDRKLPGRPDLVFPRYKTALFVHGCFWHQHANCRYAYMPAANREFWKNKLGGNVIRDAKHRDALKESGWRVLTIWECEVADPATLEGLEAAIRGN